jgi:hypothetical protein
MTTMTATATPAAAPLRPRAACLEEIVFEPGHVYVRTRTDVSAGDVFRAWVTFGQERLQLWPGITPSLYECHSVGAAEAECTEGTAVFPMKVWAREHYTWDAGKLEIRNTIVDSNMFVKGGGGVIRIVPQADGGCVVEETYKRPTFGWKGRMMAKMMPKKAPGMFEQKRSATYDILRERALRGGG